MSRIVWAQTSRDLNMPLVLHRRNDRRAKSAGFTLVELCVVIFMTALLSALLLPSLSTAKEKSMRAVCKSNIRQFLLVLNNYAEENQDVFPSSADNRGYYHSIRLSDQTYTNLLQLADNQSNIFYCPNIVFGAGSNAVQPYDPNYGYVIGYSYLINSIQTTSKGPDYWDAPIKANAVSTNELIADANFWTASETAGSLPASMAVAPHGAMGAALSHSSSFNIKPAGATPATLGAVGGNIGYLDWSVSWRNINQMQTHAASSQSDANGNW
jgi:type II secretory pathway pseudopilin PulG